MKPTPAQARILIATDNASDAEQLQSLLQEHFEFVTITNNMDRATEDFESTRPDVLLLAFATIAQSQHYYPGLFRLEPGSQLHSHRTILLCSKAELTAAFELCKGQHFDYYVLFWPQPYDGLRLPMSIWIACREMLDLNAASAPRAELFEHARHMAALEEALHHELSTGAERFAQEPGFEPVSAWVAELKNRIEPALQDARGVAASVRDRRIKLMVVEDDAMCRDMIALALAEEDYEMSFASNSAEAIRLLRRIRPDLILMDINLPDLDGISFTRRLKASARLAAIPVIMMTGDSRRENVASSIEAGAAAFVVKPFTRQSLKKKLEEVLACGATDG
jgi:CheY-like chemotaxis protein